MRVIVWLLRAFIFFALFAFSLNNRHDATVNWFFGVQWHAPLVIIVLAAFAIGAVIGVLAMVPSWWKHRRVARGRADGVVVTGAPAAAPAAGPGALVGIDGYGLRDGV